MIYSSDDDCALPPNFPVVSSRLTDMIKCIGYVSVLEKALASMA
jgi:hypothetical protein